MGGDVVLEMSISLDGFVAGPKNEIDPLHDWLIKPKKDEDLELLAESLDANGAVIMGRNTFNLIDGPKGWLAPDGTPFTLPVFVLTHETRPPETKGQTPFTYVDDPTKALELARSAAGDKNVSLMGAATGQHYLSSGLVDELRIHIAPVLLGEGISLFDRLGSDHITLEPTRVIESPAVTHVYYRVINDD
jgi:dihydrofolate reductase